MAGRTGGGQVLCKIARMLKRWSVLLKPDKQAALELIAQRLLEEGSSPPRISWDAYTQQQASSLDRSRGGHFQSDFTTAPLTTPTPNDGLTRLLVVQPVASYVL